MVLLIIVVKLSAMRALIPHGVTILPQSKILKGIGLLLILYVKATAF